MFHVEHFPLWSSFPKLFHVEHCRLMVTRLRLLFDWAPGGNGLKRLRSHSRFRVKLAESL